METNWFKKIGWVYIPISLVGTIMYLLTLGFCATVFFAVDRHAHSNTDALYGMFPYFVCAFTVLFWIASNTCIKNVEK